MNKNPPSYSKPKKTAKKITYDRLQNISLYYLERFNATEKTLRDVLKRRVYKSLKEHPDQDMQDITQWIETILQKAIDLGYVDNTRYAMTKAQQYYAQGNSIKMITQKLYAKGIDSHICDNAIEQLKQQNGQETELMAAIAYAKKKKLGIYCTDSQKAESHYSKHLASLARRGFSYEISAKALNKALKDQ